MDMSTAVSDRVATGTWTVDKSHANVGFMARHLMVHKVRGLFAGVSGTIHVGDSLDDTIVEATIDAASIDTRDEQRDGHLRSPDFLDVGRYPEMKFRSSKIEALDTGRFRLEGDLTIRDVTRPITLDATLEGTATDPYGNERAAFSAAAEIDREDWGMTWNVALERGGVLVSKKVQLEIEAEAIRQR
jgi:polyisoprenoid-binding protein YceI